MGNRTVREMRAARGGNAFLHSLRASAGWKEGRSVFWVAWRVSVGQSGRAGSIWVIGMLKPARGTRAKSLRRSFGQEEQAEAPAAGFPVAALPAPRRLRRDILPTRTGFVVVLVLSVPGIYAFYIHFCVTLCLRM